MNRLIRLKYLLFIIFSVALSCSHDDSAPPPDKGVPVIELNSNEQEYKIKIGGSVALSASVNNAERPAFSWKVGGKIVSTETSFTFVAEKLGEYFVNFRVDAENGSAEVQLKISVLEKLPPKITMQSPIPVSIGKDSLLVAEAENAENATYVWKHEGEVISRDSTCLFGKKEEMGDHIFTLKVSTKDGEDLTTIIVKVLPALDPELFFDDGKYRTVNNKDYLRTMSVPIDRNRLVLAPVICNIKNPTTFEWKVDGAVQAATGEYFTFEPTREGEYLISVKELSTQASAEVKVTCTPPEGTYRRSEGEKALPNKVYSYIPAPGQFINYQSGTVQSVLNTQQTNVNKGAIGMIGAYGGYFIVGFDHSVANVSGRPDLESEGNAFVGWCEPGILWVMQDDNGNGLPDDTWYELKGSETGKPETKQRYAITYYKPTAPNSNVLWTDNVGRSGSVDWNGYHTQQYYFPMFIPENYYMLTGTCLASTSGMSGTIETSSCYDWGYADNLSNNPDRPTNRFWIEDAIQADGSPVTLKYIDFVKMHTATIGKGAAVGEISTEAGLPIDLGF